MGEPQQPHAFLSPDDFRTMLSILEGYIQHLQHLDQKTEQFQDLHIRVKIALVQLEGGQVKTIHLSHEELTMILRAILEIEAALHGPDLGELEPYRDLMKRQVAGLRARILAGFPPLNRSLSSRLN